jgi:hypothetical protein
VRQHPVIVQMDLQPDANALRLIAELGIAKIVI